MVRKSTKWLQAALVYHIGCDQHLVVLGCTSDPTVMSAWSSSYVLLPRGLAERVLHIDGQFTDVHLVCSHLPHQWEAGRAWTGWGPIRERVGRAYAPMFLHLSQATKGLNNFQAAPYTIVTGFLSGAWRRPNYFEGPLEARQCPTSASTPAEMHTSPPHPECLEHWLWLGN